MKRKFHLVDNLEVNILIKNDTIRLENIIKNIAK